MRILRAARRVAALGLAMVMTALTLSFAGVVVTSESADAAYTTDFIRRAAPAAQATQRKLGIPASVTIAQAILESGWGRSGLTRATNNYFGMKCARKKSRYQSGCGTWTTVEYYGRRKVTERHRFRTYRSIQGSFDDHGLVIATVFRPAMAYKNDANAFVRRLHRGGYATDPNYTNLVVSIMRQYNLYRYNTTSKAKKTATKKAVVRSKTATVKMTRARIKSVQYLLNRRGYKVRVTSRLDAATVRTLIRFQRAHRLKPSGKINPATLSRLYWTAAPSSSGPQVKAVHELLRIRGYAVDKRTVYSHTTKASVKRFQARSGLRADGVVGPATWAKLFA